MLNDGNFIDVIWCILLPIIGYAVMKIIKLGSKNSVDKKQIIYWFKPIEGDKVEPIARSYDRVGTIFFIFTIVLSALGVLILLLRQQK